MSDLSFYNKVYFSISVTIFDKPNISIYQTTLSLNNPDKDASWKQYG